MASRLPLPLHTPALTAILYLPRESGFATQKTNGAVEYGDSFEIAKSRGGTMKEIGVYAEEIIAQAEIQVARSKYPPLFGHQFHPSRLRVPVLCLKSLHSQLNHFQS